MKKSGKKIIETILGVFFGTFVIAFAVAAFVVPHGIIMGGTTGLSLAIGHYIPLKLSLLVLILNGLLFILGAFTLGKKFMVTTIASTFLYPCSLSVMQMIPGIGNLTDNIMLATLYGGALLGIGVGMVIRVGASTGGTDVLALVLNKWFKLSVAVLLYIVDFVILGTQAVFSDTEQIMYGIVLLVLEVFMMNKVLLLGQAQIQIFIISDHYEEIRAKLLSDLDIGVTMMYIETGYGKAQQKCILCVVHKRRLYHVKEVVHSVDEAAFITISEVNEVRGRGFSLERKPYK